MMKFFIVNLFLFCGVISLGQNINVSGYVRDKQSGESLINANVYEIQTMNGTISNEYGFYSLSLKKGKNNLIFSYVGYEKFELDLDLKSDTVLNIDLQLRTELEEVNVYGNEGSKVSRTQMSMVEIPASTFSKIPVLLGEPDVLKVIQLLPGVQSGTEGSSGIYVRGGGPDQNLFLLDGVPVYNASHLFGFFSVFNLY